MALSAVTLTPTSAALIKGNSQPAFIAAEYAFYMLPGTVTTVAAHVVGTATAHDPDLGDILNYGLRYSDKPNRMYMAGSDSDALYSIDSDGFTATRIDASVDAFGVGETEPTGIAWHQGKLYMVGTAHSALYTLNPDTGEAERVGSDVVGFGVNEPSPQGLASHSGGLYMLGDATDALYKLDPATGEAERVSNIERFGQDRSDPTALASFGSPAELYALFDGTATVYRLNTATGVATGVASVPASGGSQPEAMAAHGGRLYVAGSQSRIWELRFSGDAITAADVQAEAGFGVGEAFPGGLATGYTQPPGYLIGPATGAIAYIGNMARPGVHTLYARVRDGRADDGTAATTWDDTVPVTVTIANRPPMFDAADYSRTFLSGSDGRITPVALVTASATDPEDHTLHYSLRASDPAERMYLLGDEADALYALDGTTGEAARVGDITEFGVSETAPRGMAWHEGRLYMTGQVSDALYTLNILTGEATLVATETQITGGGPLLFLGGVASHGGDLYVTTIVTGRLYRVDLDSLTGTQIGSDNFGPLGESFPNGIASHGSPAQLYMTGADTDRLYTVDTDTGDAAPTGDAIGFGAANEGDPLALTSHGGSLYMTGGDNNRLYTVGTDTGDAAPAGDAIGFGVGESHPHGIATGYTMPEDFAIDSATGEIAYVGASAEPGVHTLYAQASDNKTAGNAVSAAVDTTARVTITVRDRPPSFPQDSYNLYIFPGTDGSDDAALVGTVATADPEGDPLVYSLRTSDHAERMYTTGSADNALYALDSTTGTATRIGTASSFDAGITAVRGLAWHNGKLHLVGTAAGRDGIYTVDTATGAATRVALPRDLGITTTTLTGIASHKGHLYLTASKPGRLFRADLTAKTATQLGEDNFGPVNETTPTGIASHTGKLYMLGADTGKLFSISVDTDDLYDINTTSGDAIPIGSVIRPDTGNKSKNNPTGLVSHGTSLYTLGGDNRLYKLNPATGAAAPVGDAADLNTTGLNSSTNALAGIASGYRKPAVLAITPSTGTITYTGGAAVADTEYTLYAHVSDGRDSKGGPNTDIDDSAGITVRVANQPPTFAERSYEFSLYPDSDGSVAPVVLGTVVTTDPENQTLTYSLRPSDPPNRMYMVGGTTQALHALDSTTGTAARISPTTPSGATARVSAAANANAAAQFGVSETIPLALTWHNGQLHMIDKDNDSLYTLDITTGEATLVATNTQITGGGTSSGKGTSLSGVASHNGELYVTTTGTGRLYGVDLDSLTGTQIGSDDFGAIGETFPHGIASHGNSLYMIGGDTDKLYRLDTGTGAGAPVGATDEFSVGESEPAGLASHGNSLYMTGHTNNWLYTLDITTGEATRVVGTGEATRVVVTGTTTNTDSTDTIRTDEDTDTSDEALADFGVGESEARGIAAGYNLHADFALDSSTGEITYTGDSATPGVYTLYLQVSDGQDADGDPDTGIDDTTRVTITVPNQTPSFSRTSYDLNIIPGTDGSSAAEPVGAVAATDPEEDTLTYSLRASDPAERMYMTGRSNNALYALDSTTGTATRFGVSAAARSGTATGFGVDITAVRELAWHNGKLHMAGTTQADGDGIYTVDTTTGVATRVALLKDLGITTATLTGLTSHKGYLYLTTSKPGRLFRADLDAKTATQLGANNFGPVNEATPIGIASHIGELYMIGANTDKLYEINIAAASTAASHATATATPVGVATLFGASVGGESSPTGLASHGTGLYTLGDDGNRLYAIDTTTGVAAPVGDAADFNASESSPAGIASGYSKPAFSIAPTTGAIAYTGEPAITGTEYTLYAHVSDGIGSEGSVSRSADDTAAVTVSVANRAPSFSESSYSYTLGIGSDGSDAPIVLGAPAATDPEDQSLAYSLRGSDPPNRMYMVGIARDFLYALDTDTGIATPVGNADKFGVSESTPARIAWHDGQLYMTGADTESLYTLDILTGEATLVATKAQLIGGDNEDGRFLSGITSHEGDLYVTTTFTGGLYRVDLDTMTGTRIGDDDFGVTAETNPNDIASHGDPAKLYMIGQDHIKLYTLDTTTGKTSFAGWYYEFGVREPAPFGLASHGGRLYMTGHTRNLLYTVEVGTGAGTRVGAVDNFGAGETLASGIATGYTLPADFALDPVTGEIAYTGASAEPGVHILYVRVSDGLDADGVPSTAADDIARVTVTVSNQKPTFSEDSYDFHILPGADGYEDAEPVGTVAAADPEGDPLTYSLSMSNASGSTAGGGDKRGHNAASDSGVGKTSGFAIEPSTGVISYTGSSAAEGTEYTLYAHVSDGRNSNGGDSTTADDTAEITVRVVDLPPAFSERAYEFILQPRRYDSANPVVLGVLSATDPEEQSLTYSLRAPDPANRMYMVGGDTQALYTIDSTTSTVARVGDAEQFGVSETAPLALAWHKGRLYMIGQSNDSVYTLDTTTGEATLVATKTQITGSADLLLGGIASHGGELYVTTIITGRLYRIDLDTLTGTRIGNDDFGPVNEAYPGSIASHGRPAKLYMTGNTNDLLYTLDTTTGEAAPVGTTKGFGVNEHSPLALTSHNGSLYMTGHTNDLLYTLDTTTGEAAPVGTTKGFGVNEHSPNGIATGYTLPTGFAIDDDAGVVTYTGTSAEPGVYTLYAQVSDDTTTDDTTTDSVDDTVPVTVVTEDVPSAPLDVRVSPADAKLKVEWRYPATDSGSVVSDYNVRYRAVGSPTWTYQKLKHAYAHYHMIPGLANDVFYEVQVRAENANGAGLWSAPINAEPGVPTRPLRPRLTADDASLQVIWRAPVDNGSAIIDYEVRYSSDQGTTWAYWDAVTTSTATSAKITGLINGVTYWVQTRAVNGRGAGVWSPLNKGMPTAGP